MGAAMMQLVLDPGTSLFTQVLATNDFPHLAPAVVEAYRGARCTFSPVPLDTLNAYPTVEALSQDDAVQTKAGIADVATIEICVVEINHAANKRRSKRKEQQHAPLARLSNQRLLAWRRDRCAAAGCSSLRESCQRLRTLHRPPHAACHPHHGRCR